MNKFLSTRVASAVAAAALVIGVANAADRVVICEEFTATWCGPCIIFGEALLDLERDRPEELIVVQVHGQDIYALSPFFDNRFTLYNGDAFPTGIFDGRRRMEGHLGSVPATYTGLESHLNTRLATPTDVDVVQWATQVDADSWNINAQFTLEADAPAPVTMKLLTMQTRKLFPTGSHYDHCLRSVSGNPTITLQPGGTHTETWVANLVAADASNIDKISFVTLAQKTGTNMTGGAAEIYNARRIQYPYPSQPPISAAPGDTDQDGDIDLVDLATLLANFGATAGRSWGQGDFDGNGAVNLTDLASLLSNFGL